MSPSDDIDALQLGPDPDKLELYHRQQLSAMLDDALPQDQARFLRRRLQHDAELSACFERWQVCGDVLRGRHVSLLPPDFADRVARGIANDGVAVAPAAAGRRPRLLRWGGGGAALAASVALAALFVGRPGGVPGADEKIALPAARVATTSEPLATDAAADASAFAHEPTAPVQVAAAAGAAAIAIAEVPRRSRAERAVAAPTARRTRDAVPVQVAAAATPPEVAPDGSLPVLATASRVEAAFASAASDVGLPAAPSGTRPWPKASELTPDARFSVRYSGGFDAPSWARSDAPASDVLPSFPVEPGHARQAPDQASAAQP
ncbi:sigma-E factor negative regulatory protein [Luteimonas sp. S4-F44]|uniref:sigma-E factor negative regulatory protein n=1 Tax=Luteimonas sp. S4-F44 TaxID=2925842 RepID=UPI001F5367D6|nr:sigma-E factor negative regulatory protein [Luteimonas sp. S4-F44]UNK43835.1 sigma-E factor negative regulatory protein [Luteimonas sp. S4-F44]